MKKKSKRASVYEAIEIISDDKRGKHAVFRTKSDEVLLVPVGSPMHHQLFWEKNNSFMGVYDSQFDWRQFKEDFEVAA